MTSFAIAAGVMLVLAAALLCMPLLRRDRAAAASDPSLPRASRSAIVAMIALPAAAVALYAVSSNYDWSGEPMAANQAMELEDAIAKLAARLEREPADVEGWRMLARTYLVIGQPQRAVETIERAMQLNPAAAHGLQLDLAEALVLTDTDTAVGRARPIFAAALDVDPANQKALWYTGIIAARDGNRDLAVQRLTQLGQQQLPPELRQLVDQQLGALGAAVPAAATAVAGGVGGRMIRVRVALAPELAARVTPDTAVFVSAREEGIPGPPLAAVRLLGSALPTTVELSDANAMIAGRTISSVDQVQVTARVAFGGTPQTSPGDLIGTATHRRADAPDLSVTIDRVVP